MTGWTDSGLCATCHTFVNENDICDCNRTAPMTEEAIARVEALAGWFSSLSDAPAPSSSPQAAADLRALLSLARQGLEMANGADLLAKEYRPSMGKYDLHDWAVDAADLLKRLAALQSRSR